MIFVKVDLPGRFVFHHVYPYYNIFVIIVLTLKLICRCYYLQRAAIYYYTQEPAIDQEAGLPDDAVASVNDDQARYNLVLACYLGGGISLARAAELLALTWLDLRTRLSRLDIPILTGPATRGELLSDIQNA